MELDQEMPDFADMFSQLIRYARASSNYSGFLKRHLHLRNRLLDQGYKKIRLILFYLFCSSIVINTVIVTAGTFEP